MGLIAITHSMYVLWFRVYGFERLEDCCTVLSLGICKCLFGHTGLYWAL